ncbi:MAG TPA: carbohydrate porin [Chthoniobacterales bacterium]
MSLTVVAGVACLGAISVPAQDAASTPDTTEKTLQRLIDRIDQMQREHAQEMEQIRHDYQERIDSMESQMKSLKTKVDSTSLIAPPTTADGKQLSLEAPVSYDLPPLETFTRNFRFGGYIRAGVGFTGNGVGQTSSFQLPEFGTGRFRLGNENDTYSELVFNQFHLLGEHPEDIDATFRTKIAIVNGIDKRDGVFSQAAGWDIGLVEMFGSFKNVIKNAPDVTFWAGERQYDQSDIHGSDYSVLNAGGYGAGAYNMDVGIGNLGIAYFGSIKSGFGNAQSDSFRQFLFDTSAGEGSLYRHTLDLRVADIKFLAGKLKLVALGSYQQGGDFTISDGGKGHVKDSFGLAGAASYIYEFGKASFLNLNAYYGWGVVNAATNIESGVDMDKLNGAYQSALLRDGLPTGSRVDVDPYNNSLRARASAHFVWNARDDFSVATWAMYQHDDQGYTSYQDVDGSVLNTSGTSDVFGVGVRPIWWVWGNLAIQGQMGYAYVNNVRHGDGFGNSGSMGVFTIAPTIKQRGGQFTRPELRLYATYSLWDDSLKGAVGGPYYSNATEGWNCGLQFETWF